MGALVQGFFFGHLAFDHREIWSSNYYSYTNDGHPWFPLISQWFSYFHDDIVRIIIRYSNHYYSNCFPIKRRWFPIDISNDGKQWEMGDGSHRKAWLSSPWIFSGNSPFANHVEIHIIPSMTGNCDMIPVLGLNPISSIGDGVTQIQWSGARFGVGAIFPEKIGRQLELWIEFPNQMIGNRPHFCSSVNCDDMT